MAVTSTLSPFPTNSKDMSDPTVVRWFTLLGQNFNTLNTNALTSNQFTNNGLMVKTGTNTYSTATITGTANQITVTNGDGVLGNPTISLPSTVIFPGNVQASAISVPMGTSGVSVKCGGVVNSQYTDSAISTGVETDVYTQTIPAGALSADGQWLEVITFGSVNNTLGTKTFKFYVNGTAVHTSGAYTASTAATYYYRALILRTNAGSNARCSASHISSLTAIADSTAVADVATTWSGSVIIKITVTQTVANAGTTGNGWACKFYQP